MNSNGSLSCQCIKEYEGDFCTIGIIIEDSFLQITIKISCLLSVNQNAYVSIELLDRCLDFRGAYKCLNGGICAVSNHGEAFCNCLDQYEGEICELGKNFEIMIYITMYIQ